MNNNKLNNRFIMANYKIISTTQDVQWPAYVSTVILEGEQLQKAAKVLEKALVTLEAYGGPHFTISCLKDANRTGIFLYEITCVLNNSENETKECVAMILNEPWMKANSIAAASFEFPNNISVFEGGIEKLVIKRKKNIKYYKDTEVFYEENKVGNETERVTDV